jgi:hypothetical protein
MEETVVGRSVPREPDDEVACALARAARPAETTTDEKRMLIELIEVGDYSDVKKIDEEREKI